MSNRRPSGGKYSDGNGEIERMASKMQMQEIQEAILKRQQAMAREEMIQTTLKMAALSIYSHRVAAEFSPLVLIDNPPYSSQPLTPDELRLIADHSWREAHYILEKVFNPNREAKTFWIRDPMLEELFPDLYAAQEAERAVNVGTTPVSVSAAVPESETKMKAKPETDNPPEDSPIILP